MVNGMVDVQDGDRVRALFPESWIGTVVGEPLPHGQFRIVTDSGEWIIRRRRDFIKKGGNAEIRAREAKIATKKFLKSNAYSRGIKASYESKRDHSPNIQPRTTMTSVGGQKRVNVSQDEYDFARDYRSFFDKFRLW